MMLKPMVNISCPSGITHDSDITVDGKSISCVSRAEIVIEPNALIYARLDVYASLTDVQAVFDAFPVWEPIGSAPKDGTCVLVCTELDDAQSSWWLVGDERWANWNFSTQPEYWCPMPRMVGKTR